MLSRDDVQELRKQIKELESILDTKGYNSNIEAVVECSQRAVDMLEDVDYQLVKIGRLLGVNIQ